MVHIYNCFTKSYNYITANVYTVEPLLKNMGTPNKGHNRFKGHSYSVVPTRPWMVIQFYLLMRTMC